MSLFLVLVFPISLLYYVVNDCRVRKSSALLVMFIGIFSATILCAYKAFFVSSHFLSLYSFLRVFSNIFVLQIFLPLLVLFGVFFVISRKDSVEYRFENFFPLTAGFYAIYVPYLVFASELPLPFFSIFVKPVLFLSMLCLVSKFLPSLYSDIKNKMPKKNILVDSIFLLATLIIPALAESFWQMNIFFPLWIILSIVYVGSAIYLLFDIR